MAFHSLGRCVPSDLTEAEVEAFAATLEAENRLSAFCEAWQSYLDARKATETETPTDLEIDAT